MNLSVLIGTILFHFAGMSLFVALIIELWRYFIDKTMAQMQEGTVQVDPQMWKQIEKYSLLRGVFQTDQTLRSREQTAEQRRRRWYLRRQKLVNGCLLVLHYLTWGVKLLLPNFVAKTPTYRENVRVIRQDARFRLLKWVIVVWFFLLVIGFVVVFRAW